MSDDSPYLSVVVVSRNDDHGGNPLQRTQLCINSLYEQCNRYMLPAELIIVDWNPPSDRPGLAEVIRWPEDRHFIRTRVITVPPEFHQALPHSENLPLFQMIGKNVGIRRASGEYVLATNIDILFSDELMEYLSKRPLQHGQSYRVDRFDIHNDVLKESPEKIQSFSNNHVIRVNTKLGTFFNPLVGKTGAIIYPVSNAVMLFFNNRVISFIGRCFRGISRGAYWLFSICVSAIKSLFSSLNIQIHRLFVQFIVARLHASSRVPPERKNSVVLLFEFFFYRLKLNLDFGLPYLHFNGCGDFALMSRRDWDALGGYLEKPIFSWNVDSLILIDAYYYGIHEVYLQSPKNIFHVEHGAGSGWIPGKGEQLLFERLEKAGTPYFSWEDFLVYAQRWRDNENKREFLHKIKRIDYGFLEWDLTERCIE